MAIPLVSTFTTTAAPQKKNNAKHNSGICEKIVDWLYANTDSPSPKLSSTTVLNFILRKSKCYKQ